MNWNLCRKDLKSSDSSRLHNALKNANKPSGAPAMCETLLAAAHESFASAGAYNKVKLGRSSVPPAENPEHLAQWDGFYIHIDEDFFNGAPAKIVLNAFLHEQAHSLGYLHPAGRGSNGQYSDFPFNLLGDGRSGSGYDTYFLNNNQCITP